MTSLDALAFFTFALVAAITPGPSNIILTATGASVGLWRGLPCLFGVSLGMGALIFFIALGLGELLMQYPIMLKAMNWTGAALLFWLSWKIAKSSNSRRIERPSPVGFVNAALFQWINPKSWIVVTSAIGAYFRPNTDETLLYPVTFSLLFLAAALPSNLVWLTFGALLERLFSDSTLARACNIAMGCLLALSTLFLLF